MIKPIASQKEILEEIKNVLTQEKNKESDCISLYDVLNLIKEIYSEYDEIEKKYNLLIKQFYRRFDIMMPQFDYEKNELSISVYQGGDFNKIYFSKANGDLYISHSHACYDMDIFSALLDILSECYDKFMKYKQFKTENSFGIRSENSNFFVSIGNYRVSLHSDRSEFLSDLVLVVLADSHKNNYNCICNSDELICTIKNNEDELFKKIYIKIDDCPKWSRDILYSFRQKQLEEEQKIEEKNKRKETRKQKVLQIFPFLKK